MPRNVCDAVTPPRVPKTEIKPLNARQAKNRLDTARDPQPGFYALYVLAVTTGMRSGEILRLQWQDVDLDAGTLQVRRTVFNGAISTPKTSRSNRGIRHPKVAVEALRRYPRSSGWVFSSKNGTSLSGHNLHNLAALEGRASEVGSGAIGT